MRHICRGKQTQHCKARRTQRRYICRCDRNRPKEKALTRGGLPIHGLDKEKSADTIVAMENEPCKNMEVSQSCEGLNIKQQLCRMDLLCGSHRQMLQGNRGKRMQTIEKVLSARNLTEACKEVVKNKGSWGVDKMGVEQLKPYLNKNREELSEAIRSGNYTPQPIRGKEIPKRNRKKRLLGIPTVVDRMLQQAVNRVIMPQFEYMFSEYSFGFRPKRNTLQAVSKSLSYINSGYQQIVDIDLKAFFDEVDHCLLMNLLFQKVTCPITLQLIRRWLRAPIWIDGKLIKRRKGVPQGSPISPLLSNIMLHELDKEMERQGFRFVRYADDFSIYCKTKQEARKAGNSIYVFLRDKLKLPINREKSGIRRPVNFHILGYGFVPTYEKGVKGQYQLVVEESRWNQLKSKLKEVTRKTNPMSFDERVRKLKEIHRGWINNFRLANISGKLSELDGWLRNRLRYCIWHHWKKRERKRKNLIRLGINPRDAFRWSRSRLGGWAIAQSPILITTLTVSRLRRRGYEPLLAWYHKVSPHKLNPMLFPIV
jgi:RNA-directed DNA polymerase